MASFASTVSVLTERKGRSAMSRRHISFFALCLGFFIIMMDTTTIPLAYTTLMEVFDTGPGNVAWVNNSFLITYAAFLLLGGRLGDALDRKRVVVVALLTVAAGAAVSGAASTLEIMVAGRALMGVGAGLLAPQSMAYISILFPDGGRGRALGIWGAVAGLATATGPVVSQVFLTMQAWRWVMWINIPIAVVALVIVAACLPKDCGNGLRARDSLATGVYGLGIACVIVGLQLFGGSLWSPVLGSSLIVLGVGATGLLIKDELKSNRGHILPVTVWRDPTFLRTCLVSGLLGFSLTGFYLPLAFLLDVRMDYGAVITTIVMVTIAVSNAMVGPLAGHMSDRKQPEKIVRLGLILFSVASMLIGVIGLIGANGQATVVALCAAMAVAGVGTGLAFAPLANLALGRVDISVVGRAAGFYNSTRQVLSAVGGVTIALLFDGIVRSRLGNDMEAGAMSLPSSSEATAVGSMACFLVIALCLVLAAALSRSDRRPPSDQPQNYRLSTEGANT